MRLGQKGPVETLRYGLSKDAGDWNEVIFVSETQVIEELETNTLTEQGLGTKLIANFTRLMRFVFGKRKASVVTPELEPIGVKEEDTPAEEFEGKFQGFIPEGMIVSACNHARTWVQTLARDSGAYGKTQQISRIGVLFHGNHL